MNQTMNITDAEFRFASPPILADKHVHLWRVDVEAVASGEAHWQTILSPDEEARAKRFHFPRDRQRFTAVRALLRMILAAYIGCDPKELTFSYSKREKPALASPPDASEITFNVSHSGGVALVAITRARDIGVDVERVRQDLEAEAIARRFFSAYEQEQLAVLGGEELYEAFFRCWTRKEAYIKATGAGLALPLKEFDVSIASGNTDSLLATRPDDSEAARWSLRQVPAGPGYVAALCVRGRDWQLKEWSEPVKD